MSYQTLLYEVEGEIGILSYNRPEKVNAVNYQMLSELNDFWQERQRDFDTRVIVIRGAGEKGFCSGLDLNDATNIPGGLTAESIYNSQREFSNIIRLMRSCPQPIIAAVHGPAMGAGLSFALATDIRLASEDAFFVAQYININTGGADMGSSYFLWRIVGWGRAAEMCMTGDRVYAEEAYRIGLVNHVYKREELMDQARAMAKNLLSKNKLGLRLTKDALNAGLNLASLEEANKVEDRNQAYIITGGLLQALQAQQG